MSADTAPYPALWERIASSLARQGMPQAMGVRLLRAEPGCVELALPYSDKVTQQQQGFHGGATGMLNCGELRYPDGKVHICKSKEVVVNIPKGTRWYQVAGGGGGYGNPHQRPAEQVAREVRYGYVSAQRAKQFYGVEVIAGTGELNTKATATLRKEA